MRIELHIERLVLTGLDLAPRHAGRVREAVEAELRRLFGSAPAVDPRRTRSTERLVTPAVTAGRPTDPDALGRQLARALHAGLAPPAPTTRRRPDPAPRPGTGGPVAAETRTWADGTGDSTDRAGAGSADAPAGSR